MVGKLIKWLKGPRDRTVDSGIVERIEKVEKYLTFVTLRPLDSDGIKKIPLYFEIDPLDFRGRNVDIVSQRTGWLGLDFDQDIVSANMSDGVRMPYSMVKQSRKAYAQREEKEIYARVKQSETWSISKK